MIEIKHLRVVSVVVVLSVIAFAVFYKLQMTEKKGMDFQKEITVPFLNTKSVPDPTEVFSTWHWYFLDQISSSLIKWNSDLNAFEGVLAESWSMEPGSVTFNLRKNAKFSDGTSITTKDVEATIKKSIIRKKNSHFKPWLMLQDCESIKSISDNCPGVEVQSEYKIKFHLKHSSESFFLYWACPEGGVWSVLDLERDSFNPKTFSGAYSVEKRNDKLELIKNKNWVMNDNFGNRPEVIHVFSGTASELEGALKAGTIDLAMDLIRPFIDLEVDKNIFSIKTSGFNTLYYLLRVNNAQNSISKNQLIKIWDKVFPEYLKSADTFLPFPGLSGISKTEILNLLPNSNVQKPRIGYFSPYFSDKFVNYIFDDSFTLVKLTKEEWFLAYELKYPNNNLDFILTPYVASDKYPSVQIHFILGHHNLPFDVSVIDTVSDQVDKKAELNKIQSWLLKNQIIIPIVFGQTFLAYKKKMLIGKQPIIDSELQLWKINQ